MANMQKAVLDFFSHVAVPLDQRTPTQTITSAPEFTAKDAAEAGKRLGSQLEGIGILPRGRIFSIFHKPHREEATRAIRLLLTFTDRDLLLALAYFRDYINEEMFVYVTSIVALHQPQMRGVQLPPIEEVLPNKFIPAPIINEALVAERRSPPERADPIIISANFTGNDLNIEHRLSYWREDVALNAHHWHWHIVYPIDWQPGMGTMKDRKGELFYYMHQQMIARYDCERLSHNLSRVTSYHNWDEAIPEGYFPHLNRDTSSVIYSSRPINMVLQDIPETPIFRMRTWYRRIIDAIHQRAYKNAEGRDVPFDEVTGIDKLGDILEAAAISPNQSLYGDFHNSGHDLISRIHDPDERFRTEIGVMGDSATAMRDPIFYRWHKSIDLIFQELKNNFNPYTRDELTWSAVNVESISVQGRMSERPNNLQTFWQDRIFELQRGLNFNSSVPISVRTRHLQHEKFAYSIVISNSSSSAVEGTIRIFMAPARNEVNRPFALTDQRHVFIELDKFQTTLNPGNNTVTRESSDSNVTIATMKSFTQLVQESESNTQEQQSSCSCGLPDHLLIPRGKPEGMEFQLFVMVTNANDDRVEGASGNQCRDAPSYCGILNARYPDRKAMGFPFDRRIEARTLESFRTPNMNFVSVSIRFRNEVAQSSGSNVFFPEIGK